MESSKEVRVERNAERHSCVYSWACVFWPQGGTSGQCSCPRRATGEQTVTDTGTCWNQLQCTDEKIIRNRSVPSVHRCHTINLYDPVLSEVLARHVRFQEKKKKITFMSVSLLPMVTEGGRSTCCSDAECAVWTTEVQLFLTWCWVSMVTRESARQWCVCQE